MGGFTVFYGPLTELSGLTASLHSTHPAYRDKAYALGRTIQLTFVNVP